MIEITGGAFRWGGEGAADPQPASSAMTAAAATHRLAGIEDINAWGRALLRRATKLRPGMRHLRLIMVVVTAATALAALPAVALAESPVITDCSRHDRLTRHYTVSQLRNALSHLPAEVTEYTSCQAVIQQQLLTQVQGLRARGGSHPSASGGSSPLVPIVIAVAVVVLAGGGLALVARRRALQS
jgi:hypothetical protein